MPSDLQSRSGIIWTYRFDAEGRPAPIPREVVPELAPEEGFIWLHLDDPAEAPSDCLAASGAAR